MTEAVWLTTNDYFPLNACLWEIARKRTRKYRLIGCGIYRMTWHLFSDKLESDLLGLAEAFADDPTLSGEVSARFAGIMPSMFPSDVCDPPEHADYSLSNVARVVSFIQDRLSEEWYDRHSGVHDLWERDDDDPLRKDWDYFTGQVNVVGAVILRDIFGNPFRPVSVDPSWLTSTVLALATGIYEERAFDRMPILADSLQDAGCANEDVLNHCRGQGVHVRGCWVVDLILGKS